MGYTKLDATRLLPYFVPMSLLERADVDVEDEGGSCPEPVGYDKNSDPIPCGKPIAEGSDYCSRHWK